VEYLQKNGYAILETNWTFKKKQKSIIKKEKTSQPCRSQNCSSLDFIHRILSNQKNNY
jgi:putative endonuclease